MIDYLVVKLLIQSLRWRMPRITAYNYYRLSCRMCDTRYSQFRLHRITCGQGRPIRRPTLHDA